MYSGGLGDCYTGLGAQTLMPKKDFSRFLFSVVFQQKICWNSDQRFHNASNYFEMAWKIKIQTEEKNNQTIRDRREKQRFYESKTLSFI